jgi:thiol-disulfide isomerase/thioredoxin
VNRNRWRTCWAAALAVGALLVATPRGAAAQSDVRLPGLDGGQLTGADLAHGATVIVVWASWSPRCRDIVEQANALAARWGSRARVVTVDFQEDPAAVRSFLAGKKLTVPVFLDRDGEFSKAHAVTTLPGLVVVRDGAARYQGKLPADPDTTISQALGG